MNGSQRWAGSLVLLAIVASHSMATPIESHWMNAVGGAWTNGANWSTAPDFPANTSLQQYHAIIDLAGPAYTVALGSDIEVSDFTLNGANALVAHDGGVFRVLGQANLTAGVFHLSGGTLDGGVWNIAGGALTVDADANNRLRGVVLNGVVQLNAVGARLTLADGLTGSGMLSLAGYGAKVTAENSQTLDGGVLRFDPVSLGNKSFTIAGATTTTLGSAQRITGGRGVIDGAGMLVNHGLISADAASQTLEVAPQHFENHGVAECRDSGVLTLGAGGRTWSNAADGTINAAGGTLNLLGTWENHGSISAVDSSVTLGGSFNTASLTGFSRTGGTVDITGDLDNSGATLTLNAATGDWRMSGGKIHGGHLAATDGAKLILQQNAGNLLDGVSVDAELDFSAGGWVRATTSTSFGAPVNLDGNGARLGLDAGQTIDNLTITMGGTGNVVRQLSAEGSGDFVLGANAVIQGAKGVITSGLFDAASTARIVNQGRIAATGGGSLSIGPAQFRNEGLVEAINGGTLVLGSNGSVKTPWTNAGILRTGAGSLLNLSGRFATADIGTIERAGGQIVLSGELDNTGATLDFNDATGSWQTSAATIHGGTINTSATAGLVFGGGYNYLDGVTYNGDIALAPSASNVYLRFSPTTVVNGVLQGKYGKLRLDTGGTHNLDITATTDCDIALMGDDTATFGPQFRLTTPSGDLTGSGLATLVNLGTITADGSGSGSWLSVKTSVFRNEGTLRVVAGKNIAVGAPTSNVLNAPGGLLEADGGKLALDGHWKNEGIVRIKNNGTLALNGTFQTADVGVIERLDGSVLLGGILDNEGAVLRLDADTGVWGMKWGKINGGTLDLTAGSYLRFDPTGGNNPRNELHDVSILGNLNLTGSTGAVYIYGGLDAPDGVTVTGGSIVGFPEDTVLHDPITLSGYVYPNSITISALAVDGPTSLTVASDGLIHGGSGKIGVGGSNRFVNEGVVQADVADQMLQISARENINRGLWQALDGGTLRIAYNSQGDITWRNETEGVIRGIGSTVGVVEVSQDSHTQGTNLGLIEVTGGTLTLGGVWTNDGSIVARSGARTTLGVASAVQNAWTNNTLIDLQGVTVEWDKRDAPVGGLNNGEIRLTNSTGRIAARWRNDGVLRLTGASNLRVAPATLSNLVGTTLEGGTWLIGAGCTLNMDAATIETNNAALTLEGPGSTFAALAALHENQGTLTLAGGRDLTLVALDNGGTLEAGPGSLFSLGEFTQAADGVLRLHLESSTSFGSVAVSQLATLSGTLRVDLAPGYAPMLGDSYHLLVANSSTGAFGTLSLPTLPGGLAWATDYTGGFSLNVIPEPGALGLVVVVLAAYPGRRESICAMPAKRILAGCRRQ